MDTLGRNLPFFSRSRMRLRRPSWGSSGSPVEGSGSTRVGYVVGFQWGKRSQARTRTPLRSPPNKEIWRKKRCHISVLVICWFFAWKWWSQSIRFLQTTNGFVVHLVAQTPPSGPSRVQDLPASREFRFCAISSRLLPSQKSVLATIMRFWCRKKQ